MVDEGGDGVSRVTLEEEEGDAQCLELWLEFLEATKHEAELASACSEEGGDEIECHGYGDALGRGDFSGM